MAGVRIRAFVETDWPEVWEILRGVLAQGESYPYAVDSSEASMHETWIEIPAGTFVAEEGDGVTAGREDHVDASAVSEGTGGTTIADASRTPRVLGFYQIRPNQPGLGSHVCNCGYVVSPSAQGRGVAAAMCEDSQARAVAMGFRAMQFNLVVATNERAVRLWKRLGYETVGRLPGVFKHPSLGYVDAFVMFKQLVKN